MYTLHTEWHLALYERLETQAQHLSLSGDARHVVVTTCDKKMRVYDTDSLELVRTITHGSNSILACGEFSPDGGSIACGPKKVTLFDAHTGKRLVTLQGHKKEVAAMCFTRDGERLWTGASAGSGRKDDSLRLWDVSSGDCLWQGLHGEPISRMVSSEGEATLYVSGTRYSPTRCAHLIALDTTSYEDRWRVELPGERIFSLCISPVDGSIISCHGPGQAITTLSWFDPDSGAISQQKHIPDARFVTIDASAPEPVLLALVNDDHDTLSLRAHDIEDGTSIATAGRVEGVGYGFDLVVTPQGRVFAGTVGHVAVWDCDEGS